MRDQWKEKWKTLRDGKSEQNGSGKKAKIRNMEIIKPCHKQFNHPSYMKMDGNSSERCWS